MDKIKHFESLPAQTVEQFNSIFVSSPLKDLSQDLEVEIGELADTETTRFLLVGSLIVKHRFVKDTEQAKMEELNERLRD